MCFRLKDAYISRRLGLRFTLTDADRFHRTRIDLKTLLKVDQNENAYISYYCGQLKTHQKENNDQKYSSCVCLEHAKRVQLTVVTTSNSIVFQRFSVDSRKHIKTTLVWTRIDRNRTLLKTH